MARAPFTSPLAEELAGDVLDRFLRYVRVDTQAAYRVPERPSTEKQLELSRLLVQELRDLGLDAELTTGAAVFSGLSTNGAPVVGLIAHVDTTPDVSADVSPIVHEAWDGALIALPGDSRQVLDPKQLRAGRRVGHDIVTSDGTTLLGADDKAGIAEIMAAVSYLARHPERTRAPLRVAFTVDEEVGRGAEDFDLEAFGADVAYTLDGSSLGELETETFSATSIRVTIRGLSVHPGTAKGKLVNAVKLAAELVASLPADRLSPETTENRRDMSIRTASREARRRRSSTSSRATTQTTCSSSTFSCCAISRGSASASRVRTSRSSGATPTATCARTSRSTRGSSRLPSKPFVVRVSSPSSRSRAAGRTVPFSRHEAFRPRISSLAARSTTRP